MKRRIFWWIVFFLNAMFLVVNLPIVMAGKTPLTLQTVMNVLLVLVSAALLWQG